MVVFNGECSSEVYGESAGVTPDWESRTKKGIRLVFAITEFCGVSHVKNKYLGYFRDFKGVFHPK